MKQTPELLEISEKAYARALPESSSDADETQIRVSMFVLGPVLLAFVFWVLEQAGKSGKRRLYFLSRDGWLMYRMAQTLCRAGRTSREPGSGKDGAGTEDSGKADSGKESSRTDGFPECRYLYASRYAWRIPEQHLIGDKSLDRICRGGMHVTFSDMMSRAGLTDEDAARIAELVCPGQRADETLSRREIRRLRGPLSGCREFRELAERRSRSRYEAAVGYLAQEGLLENIPYALVDSGWTGTMQESLGHLLKSAGCIRPVEGYYFGLYSLPETADGQLFHGWYFEPGSRAGRKAHFSNCLFECVFTAPHGMTEGYERKAERWQPVFAPLRTENEKWVNRQMRFLTLYMETLTEWCAGGTAAEDAAGRLKSEAERLRVSGLLKSFMSDPSREESACYGNVVFSDEVTERRARPLAARLTQRQLMEHHLLSRLCLTLFPGRRRLQDSGWIEGSARLYGGSLCAWHRAGALLYKYALYVRMRHDFKKRRKAA